MRATVCPKCGTPNPGMQKFCENCGYPFPDEAENVSTEASTEAAPGVAAPFDAPPAVTVAPPLDAQIPQPVNNIAPQSTPAPQNTGTVPVQPQMNASPMPNNGSAPIQGQMNAAPMQSQMNPQFNNGAPMNGAPMNGAPMNGAPMQPMYSPVMQQPPKSGGGAIAIVFILIILLLGGGLAAAFLLLNTGKAKEIEVSETSITIEEGETYQIDITNYEDLGNVTLSYTSADEDVVEITREYDDGFDIEGIEKGKTKITVSGGKYDDVIITVKVTESEDEEESSSSSSAASPEPAEPEPSTGSGPTEPDPEPEVTVPDPQGSSDEMPVELDQNSDGSYNLWSYGTETVVGTVYEVNGYTVDDEYSGSSTIFFDSNSMSGIYYTCYAEMPLPEWTFLESGDVPDGSTQYSMTSHDLGLSCNGSKLYYAERYDDTNQFEEYEMYYIYYSYYNNAGGYTDYVTIELYPDQAANWSKEDFQDFAREVFGL